MRLRWIRLEDARFVNGRADVEFGGLTAIWGRNDAGKSTLLRAVHDSLAALTGRDLSAPGPAPAVSAIALALSSGEADALASYAITDLDSDSSVRLQVFDEWCEVSLHGDQPQTRAAREARYTGAGLRPYIDLCLAGSDLPARDATEVANTLEEERTIVLSPQPEGHWLGGWALPAEAVMGLHAGPESWRSALEDDDESATRPWHTCLPIYLGHISTDGLPTPILAPLDWPGLSRRLLRSCSDAADALTDRLDDSPDIAPEGSGDDWTRRLLTVAAAAATRRAPLFLTDRYTFEASPVDHAGPSVGIEVCRDRTLVFPLDDLAEGYKLWAQLAVHDVVEVIDSVSDSLSRAAPGDPGWAATEAVATSITAPHFTAEALEDAVVAIDDIRRVWTAARAPTRAGDTVSSPLQSVAEAAPRLYVIDEPERHLHPGLQRDARDWMETLAKDHSVQFLYASHAPAMLGPYEDARLAHVERAPDPQISVRPLDPRDLAATDRELTDLGMDRGEALALYRAILLVEGETDRAVLEALYPGRLRELGLLVQPFRGVAAPDRLLEAETLFRVLGPPFHLMIDNCDSESLKRLTEMTADELGASQDSKNLASLEERFVAKVRRSALLAGRDVKIHAIPERDILGTLDDECIRAVVASRGVTGDPWPGWQAVAEKYGPKYSRALARFGIGKDPSFFAEVAREMRRRNLTAPQLDAVLDAIWAELRGLS